MALNQLPSINEFKVAHRSVSRLVLFRPHFAITEQALRFALQNQGSHDTMCFTVLCVVGKYVCFMCGISGSLSLLY